MAPSPPVDATGGRRRTAPLPWAVFTLLALSAVEPLAAAVVEVSLVPERYWKDGEPEVGRAFPTGTVFWYRPGSSRPDLVSTAGQPVELPPGEWRWVAEAPGHVSVDTGVLFATTEMEDRRIVWPVAPACEADVSRLRWTGITRLDVVSLERGATYVTSRGDRPRFNVPAGRLIAYSVDPRGLDAISPVFRCTAGEIFPLARPEAPAADRRDVMVSLLPPKGARATPPEAVLRSSDRERTLPTATLIAGGWWVFFFLDVAVEPARLLAEHPAAMTRALALDLDPGRAYDLGDVVLAPRATVELEIDYRPARTHRTATVTLLRCGDDAERAADCLPAAESQRLLPGRAVYPFHGLDAGSYLAEAMIDDERLRGLGSGASWTVDASTPTPFRPAPERLVELHVYGHLLVDDEPVGGEVRLHSLLDAAAVERRFPTDDELLYHLYGFGQLFPKALRAGLPEALRELGDEGFSLPLGTAISACDDEGFCRPLHPSTTFTGDGRLDLDLGNGRWTVRVVSAASGEAVAGASVMAKGLGRPEMVRHVFADRALVSERPAAEHLHARSDGDGVARLRGLGGGATHLVVRADGYRLHQERLDLPVASAAETRVELERDEERGALRLRLATGEPAAGAVAVAVTAAGAPLHPCVAVADSLGQLEPTEPCLGESDHRYVVFHLAAGLTLTTPRELAQVGELVLAPRPVRPLRLRLRDGAGVAVSGEPVELLVDGVHLGADVMILAGRAGFPELRASDAAGTLTYPFLAADGVLPTVVLPRAGGGARLYRDADGDVGEVVVER